MEGLASWLTRNHPVRRYLKAVLAAALVVLLRAALDPVLLGDHALMLPLLAVVFLAWRHGFWPGLLTLILSVAAISYLFIEPRHSFEIAAWNDRIAVGLVLITGLGCAWLGEAQRRAQHQSEDRAAELLASEERYRFLAETLPALVWSSGADGISDYHNGRWYEYTGLPRDYQKNLTVDVVHPEDQIRRSERWQRACETGTKYQNEVRLRRADGVYRWFLAQALPMRGPDGKVSRWFGTAVDIDDQKRLQIELTRSLERFRLLTEAIPQIVWNADASGQITYFNQRWLDFTGLPVESAHDRGWLTAIHPDDAERVYKAWQMTIANSADRFAVEFRLRRAMDDTYWWFLTVAVPMRRADGTVDQWIGSMANIHDQKEYAQTLEQRVSERTSELLQQVEDRRQAEELAQATALELARSNEELEKFAYVASHDLQEPLRKIQSFGGRLRSKFRDQLGEQGKDYLDRVLNSSGRMRRLIDDLLSLSRVTTAGLPFAPVDLTIVAEGVLSDLEERIEETGATVTIDPLPTIDADATQMRQLLQNLIGNALKFRRPDMPPVVTVSTGIGSTTDDGAEPVCGLTFTDNGIGFDEKYLNRIFQVFQRLHGRQEYEGTGIGLAICRKIVERHGGTITAQSTPGEGTTFIIGLPIHHATEPHDD